MKGRRQRRRWGYGDNDECEGINGGEAQAAMTAAATAAARATTRVRVRGGAEKRVDNAGTAWEILA